MSHSSRQSQFAREDFARAIALDGKLRAGLGFDERAESKRKGREEREKIEVMEREEKEKREQSVSKGQGRCGGMR